MTFDITEISVTHTYTYQPHEYLEFCESSGQEPTQEGFIEYTLPEIQQDFPISEYHPCRMFTSSSPERTQDDAAALDAVAALLNEEQWSTDRLIEAVADMVRATGRAIDDVPS